MSWTKTTRTAAEELGPQHYKNSSTVIEVEHVKEHRTEKERQQMSPFESSSPKAMRIRMSQQREERWEEVSRRRQEQARSSRKEKVYAALQYAASFHCLVEEWKDCEELKPQPKEKVDFRGEEKVRRQSIGRSGVPQQTSIGA